MNMVTRVQILDEATRISHSAYILAKVSIQLFSLQLSVNIRQTGLFNLGMETVLGERKLWIQTC